MSHDDPVGETMAEQSHDADASLSEVVDGLREASAGEPADVAARVALIRSLRHAIVKRLEPVLAAVMRDAGKVRTEALLTDVLPTLEQLRHYEREAPKALRSEHRKGSLLFLGGTARVEYMPYGIVLVIAPWNNPFQLAMVPAASALLGGNAVVIKPSERTSRVAAELRACFEQAGIGTSLVRVVEGGPEVVQGLVAGRPDLVFFTGGTAGGQAVLHLAADHLIPAVLELGGKDPMVVFADADLRRAARAAVYGAFAHDGQHCISVERLYVEAPAYDQLASDVAAGAMQLARGRDISDRLPAPTSERVQRQIASSLKAGARLLTTCPNGVPALPAVLADVRHDMPIMRQECFGPVVAVVPFRDEAEAVALANDSEFGLNASLWTGDRSRARRVASQLQSGCVCINDVLINAGHPSLPFGGVKRSGLGRYHGSEGLLAFVQPKALFERRRPAPEEIHWFPYDDGLTQMTEDLIRLRYGRSNGLLGWLRGWRLLRQQRVARLRRVRADRSQGSSHGDWRQGLS
ncbi:MAG TPA: aldehyde dehydrogenase family protein [Phycisphaerae bacterium]|nr:aldehyde dehydrogenase family protein [Phycisphaerae bacterium]